MIIVDASALVPALADDGSDGDQARARFRGETLAAPELIDLEVASVLRRLTLSGSLSAGRGDTALTDLHLMPLRRVSHQPLLRRCWELRDNLTVYDASYVSLAEMLDSVLVTADVRLSRAPGLRCEVEVLASR